MLTESNQHPADLQPTEPNGTIPCRMAAAEPAPSFAILINAVGGAARFPALADAISPLACPLILILRRNDDVARALLQQWRADRPATALIPLFCSPRRALTAGLAEVSRGGQSHALLIGLDEEQHPADAAILLAAARRRPSSLIAGVRAAGGSRAFSAVCDALFWLETGVRLRDSRRGPRVYPMRLIDTVRGKHKRFAGPADLLAWSAWAGCPIAQVDLPAPTLPALQRSLPLTLHLMLRELGVHALLLLRELGGLPYPKYAGGAPNQPKWRGLWQWLNPLRAWRELRSGEAAPREMAAGVALGVFVANLPAYGVQTFLAIYAARRLHLNPVAAVAGSQASMPPIGPALIAAAMWVGHYLIHHRPLAMSDLNPFDGHFLAHFASRLADWSVGSLLVGAVSATIAFFTADVLFRQLERRQTAQPPAPSAWAEAPDAAGERRDEPSGLNECVL